MEKQTVSDSFQKMAYGVFEREMGWTRQESDLALEVAGQYAVSALRFATRLLEKLDAAIARTWLETCLTESTNFEDAANRLRRHIDTRFTPENLVCSVRGILVALDGNYGVDSPLDDLPVGLAPRKPSYRDYAWRPAFDPRY